MFTRQTTVRSFFEQAYVPECLPGPPHRLSRAEYTTQLGKLQQFFDVWCAEQQQPVRPITLGDLSDPLVKLAMAWWLERGNSTATVNKLYRHLKAVWQLAWRLDVLPQPCRTRPYREARREPRAWLPEELAAIVGACYRMPGMVGPVQASIWWPALVGVFATVGARRGATMRLEVRDLDLKRGEILLRAESQKQRADQVFDLLPGPLDALRALAPHERGLVRVFGDWPYDGDAGWRTLGKHLKRLLVRAGLFASTRDVTRRDLFHKFRRGVATEIAARMDLATAQAYLGHSSSQTTLRYIDQRQIARPKASDVLTDPLAPTRGPRLMSSA